MVSRQVKRLSLPLWVEECFYPDGWFTLDDVPTYCTVVAPVFGRDGIYLDRQSGKCWFEVNGQARSYERASFEYDLACLNASEINHRQVEALRGIIKQKLATQEQKRLLMYYTSHMGARSVRRETTMRLMAADTGNNQEE
jgi:hypothetical protein